MNKRIDDLLDLIRDLREEIEELNTKVAYYEKEIDDLPHAIINKTKNLGYVSNIVINVLTREIERIKKGE